MLKCPVNNFMSKYADYGIPLLRISIGLLMLVHGVPKMLMLFGGGEIMFPSIFGLGPTFSLVLAVFSEVVCSVLLIIGLATRTATLPLIGTMLVAVFIVHGQDPWGRKEMAILYLLVYIVLLFTGGGKCSLDQKCSQ